MTTLRELQHRYSWGPIPQWELDKLEQPEAAKAEAPKPRRGRPPKSADVEGENGDSTADSDPST